MEEIEKIEQEPIITEPVLEEEPIAPIVPDDSQYSDRARLQGWVPKEEFRGDESKWIPAKDFVDRADHMMPILKSVNSKIEKKLVGVTEELSAQKEMVKRMLSVQSKQSEDLYTTRNSDFEARKEAAVEAGDVEGYRAIIAEQAKISKPEPMIAEDPKPAEPPEIARWKGDNSWYDNDPELREYSDIIAARMAKQGHSLKEYDFCNAVKEKVVTMFPDKFQNPNRKKETVVDETNLRGTETNSASTKKGMKDLPEDARMQCAKNIKEIPGYTKEKYLKDYFEEGE